MADYSPLPTSASPTSLHHPSTRTSRPNLKQFCILLLLLPLFFVSLVASAIFYGFLEWDVSVFNHRVHVYDHTAVVNARPTGFRPRPGVAAEVVEEKVEGKKASRWTTEEEDALRAYRWTAEPDESLLRVVEGLSEHDRSTREWLVTTRPVAAQGSPVGYSAVRPFVPIREGGVEGHRGTGGPGEFEGGSREKYDDLLEEWRTGRKVRSVGKWEDEYARLHAEILSGEKEARLLEDWWQEAGQGGGLADRLLGSLTTLLFSLLTDRALLTTWDSPIPLSLLFDSPYIDWSGPAGAYPALQSLSDGEGEDDAREPHPLWGNETLLEGRKMIEVHNMRRAEGMRKVFEAIETGEYAKEAWPRLDRLNRGWAIHAFTSSDVSISTRLHSLGMTLETAYSQLLHFLFRPKLETMMFIDQYSSVFSLPSVFAVGIQVRTGDMFMANPKLDALNTVERHQHFFDCAAEVVETYALPGQRPLYFLISDSATLRRDALSTYPDRVVISGLEQHHNDIERKKHNYELKKGEKKGEKEKEGAEVEEILRQLEGLHATVATSWIFAEMDFALLSYKSGFGRIPTWVHGKPNRAIELPRTEFDQENPEPYRVPEIPSCRLASSLTSFEDLASNWSMG